MRLQNKISHEDMKTLPYIIAIDFDGTLVEDKFPDIGVIKQEVLDLALAEQRSGKKLILWTCRDNNTPEQHLSKAVRFCAEHGLHFDAVNENLSECKAMFNNDTRKVYANEYWDDKAFGGWMLCR